MYYTHRNKHSHSSHQTRAASTKIEVAEPPRPASQRSALTRLQTAFATAPLPHAALGMGWGCSTEDQHHAAPTEGDPRAGRGPAGSIPTSLSFPCTPGSGPHIPSVCTGTRGPAHRGRLGMAAVPSAALHPEEQDGRQRRGNFSCSGFRLSNG